MIKSAEFVKSISTSEGYAKEAAESRLPEIAVAGRSNVGKSSFINMLANRRQLAKTSSTPGRTRLINLFDINRGEFLLVDLPGYGYARAGRTEIEKYSRLTDGYFNTSKRLAHVFSLVDVRHDPTAQDIQMISFLYEKGIPFTVVATKGDKLSKAGQARRVSSLAAALGVGRDNIIVTSASTGQGRTDVESRIAQALLNS